MIGQIKAMENDLIARLESMPFEEARSKILTRQLGNDIDSPNHQFCLSWLREKEAGFRERRESETLVWARHAACAAYAAAIIAAISIAITILKS